MQAPATPDADAQVRTQYAAVRERIADGTPITVLHIGAARTAVAAGRGTQPDTVLLLDIGWQQTATRHFAGKPPTAIGLEEAIATVEDEVTRARDVVAPASGLFSTDACVRDIARAAGVSGSAPSTLTLDAVEQTFGRLAALAHGAPASHAGLPADAGFAAALLILREFMHHLHCPAITLAA